ncbi:ceramide glucosyltransferase-B-like isoform X2 [Halichondria panicea]|uniref:ceramide glucosyltransferase-B-like isoform X2 n=1 Tax=Halichondria panicea TaxID=6063 RepID=UPI00312B9798
MDSFRTAFFIISICLLSWSLIYICLHWIVIIYGKRKLHSKKELSNKLYESQGVSIIKPLYGYDRNLKENLETFFKLDYPKFELLLCVGEEKDGPSLPIISELRAKYPTVDVKVFQGGEDVGPNPKICNMMPGYKSSQYPLIWFSDSTIYTPPDNLTEMMSHIGNPKVAIVHQMPFVCDFEGFAGYLDKVYFGTQLSRIYLLSVLLKQNCLCGASLLMSKHSLGEAGGLQAFGDTLAEDNFLGRAMLERGWELSLSTKLALLNQGTKSAALYRARVTRWTRLRVAMLPFPSLLEPFSECFCISLLGALSAKFLGFSFLVFLISYVIIWFLSDMVLLKIVSNGTLGSLWLVFLAWLYRESTTYWCFLSGLVGREVTWGGKRYRLLLWGKAVRINDSIPETV